MIIHSSQLCAKSRFVSAAAIVEPSAVKSMKIAERTIDNN